MHKRNIIMSTNNKQKNKPDAIYSECVMGNGCKHYNYPDMLKDKACGGCCFGDHYDEKENQ